VAFLAGAPGSGIERLAAVLAGTVPAFRSDRFDAGRAPDDLLQNFHVAARLAGGELDAATLAQDWRAHLPARGVANGEVIDWLLWWDNALLPMLRTQLPQANVLIALRDPRDMLLDWLAHGAPAPLAMGSPTVAAQWLATLLNQLAALHEQDLFPHRLLRMDAAMDDAQALSALVGTALGLELPVAPVGALGPRRFPAGHWRGYAEALAEPFRLLTPVARRLGYETT
jgi:hypothetical protein